MEKVTIALITLGSQKHPVSVHYLENWNSRLFSIHHRGGIKNIPNAEGPDWNYLDSQLAALIRVDQKF
jgi:hypothetical protein